MALVALLAAPAARAAGIGAPPRSVRILVTARQMNERDCWMDSDPDGDNNTYVDGPGVHARTWTTGPNTYTETQRTPPDQQGPRRHQRTVPQLADRSEQLHALRLIPALIAAVDPLREFGLPGRTVTLKW